MISALKASWRTWNRSKVVRYYFVNEELDLSGSHGNVQKPTRSLVRTSCRLRFSYAPRCEWTSAGLSYANLLGNAPGFSRSFPAVSPNDSRNDGLWTKAPSSKCSEHNLACREGRQFFRLTFRIHCFLRLLSFGKSKKLTLAPLELLLLQPNAAQYTMLPHKLLVSE